jgi:hypothetical protein
MAGTKIDKSGFIADHLEQDVHLSVQCYFLYKGGQQVNKVDFRKHSALYNTDYYLLEPFYKPIHFYFDITKIVTNHEPAIS